MCQKSNIVGRRGAVAIILRQDRMLVIRRSQHVIAPGAYCFPGGGIEADETEEEAVARELQEEINCKVQPIRRLWRNVTPWGVHLAWWLAEMGSEQRPVANPSEVESLHWLTAEEMAELPETLESNREFLRLLAMGEIKL